MFSIETQVPVAGIADSGVSGKLVTPSLPVNGHVSLTTTLQGLMALEPHWLKLEKQCATAPSIFQSYAWVSNWAKTYITENSSHELCIITGFQNERLVFVLPLMKQKLGPITILRWLTEPYGQYGDALIAANQNSKAWFSNALVFIQNLKNIDVIRLRHVRADAAIADTCRQSFTDARHDEKAPYLDLTQYDSDESYEARYSSTQRKRRKKIRKELEQLGPIEFEVIPNGVLGDAAINQSFVEKNLWLEERGRQNRVMKCPSHAGFLKDISRSRTSNVDVVISQLSAGGKPVSWEIGFNFQGCHFAYITSHVNTMTDLSPGRLHMDQSQRNCIKHGLQKFDLMVPHDHHKESWSSGLVETSDHYLPLSLRGRLYGKLYLRTLRPVLRHIYYKSPPWLLKLAKPVLGI